MAESLSDRIQSTRKRHLSDLEKTILKNIASDLDRAASSGAVSTSIPVFYNSLPAAECAHVMGNLLTDRGFAIKQEAPSRPFLVSWEKSLYEVDSRPQLTADNLTAELVGQLSRYGSEASSRENYRLLCQQWETGALDASRRLEKTHTFSVPSRIKMGNLFSIAEKRKHFERLREWCVSQNLRVLEENDKRFEVTISLEVPSAETPRVEGKVLDCYTVYLKEKSRVADCQTLRSFLALAAGNAIMRYYDACILRNEVTSDKFKGIQSFLQDSAEAEQRLEKSKPAF